MHHSSNYQKITKQVVLRLLFDLSTKKSFKENNAKYIDGFFELIGKDVPAKTNAAKKSALLFDMHQNVAAKLLIPASPFFKWLQKHFHLSDLESELLVLTAIIQENAELSMLLKKITLRFKFTTNHYVSALLRISNQQAAQLLNSKMALVSSGLINISREPKCFHNLFNSNPCLSRLIFKSKATRKDLLMSFLIDAPKAKLNWSNFPLIKKDINWIKKWLCSVRTKPSLGNNILISGSSGTGKTELSRYLLQASGFHGYELKKTNANGALLQHEDKLINLRIARYIVNPQRELIIYDELDDVFEHKFESFEPEMPTFTTLLESGHAPILWNINSLRSINPIYRRYFNYFLQVGKQTHKYKKAMLQTAFSDLKDSSILKQISTIQQLSPAEIQSSINTLQKIDATKIKESDIHHYFNNQLKIRGVRPLKKAECKQEYKFELEFNPSFSNADIELDSLQTMIEQTHEGRFLLAGPPGTGKTGFVQYLAKSLDIPLVEKTGADILGSYVGQSEKAIRDMFVEASDQDAILLIDEADSFLSSRDGHHRMWETTLLNEFLVHLERFKGLFFAASNRSDSFDVALQRRFDFHINFNYLKSKQINELFCAVLNTDLIVPKQVSQLSNLTPSDFSSVVRKARLMKTEFSEDELTNLLIAESERKVSTDKRTIGFY